jgi:hypothetical protein
MSPSQEETTMSIPNVEIEELFVGFVECKSIRNQSGLMILFPNKTI